MKNLGLFVKFYTGIYIPYLEPEPGLKTWATAPAKSCRSSGSDSETLVKYNPFQMHPEVREDVKSLIPTPDLAAMEERLNQFKRNIYKVPTYLYYQSVNRDILFLAKMKRCLTLCMQEKNGAGFEHRLLLYH
jgi:hypothetical protein